jgi:hypothetical protein
MRSAASTARSSSTTSTLSLPDYTTTVTAYSKCSSALQLDKVFVRGSQPSSCNGAPTQLEELETDSAQADEETSTGKPYAENMNLEQLRCVIEVSTACTTL